MQGEKGRERGSLGGDTEEPEGEEDSYSPNENPISFLSNIQIPVKDNTIFSPRFLLALKLSASEFIIYSGLLLHSHIFDL